MKRTSLQELNEMVYKRVAGLLYGKNRAELCRAAGIPESTLATQLGKEKLEIDQLWLLAPELGTTVADLTHVEEEAIPPAAAVEVLGQIERLIRWARSQSSGEVVSAEEIARAIIGGSRTPALESPRR